MAYLTSGLEHKQVQGSKGVEHDDPVKKRKGHKSRGIQRHGIYG